MHHPKADIDGLYVKRKGGGRGMLQNEAKYEAEIINIAEYMNTKYIEDQFVYIFNSHESNKPNMNSSITAAEKVAEELNQSNEKGWHKKEWDSTHKNTSNVKVQNIFHGRNNIMCSINCKYRTAATLYTPEIWFVSSV